MAEDGHRVGEELQPGGQAEADAGCRLHRRWAAAAVGAARERGQVREAVFEGELLRRQHLRKDQDNSHHLQTVVQVGYLFIVNSYFSLLPSIYKLLFKLVAFNYKTMYTYTLNLCFKNDQDNSHHLQIVVQVRL